MLSVPLLAVRRFVVRVGCISRRPGRRIELAEVATWWSKPLERLTKPCGSVAENWLIAE